MSRFAPFAAFAPLARFLAIGLLAAAVPLGAHAAVKPQQPAPDFTLARAEGGNLRLADGSGLASNYTLAGGTHSLTINPRGITASFTAADRLYDATDIAAVTNSTSGLISADQVAVGFADARFADKSAAAGKLVTISGLELTGADAGNYALLNPLDQNNDSFATTTAISNNGTEGRVASGRTSAGLIGDSTCSNNY
jgi:hypothetical protein